MDGQDLSGAYWPGRPMRLWGSNLTIIPSYLFSDKFQFVHSFHNNSKDVDINFLQNFANFRKKRQNRRKKMDLAEELQLKLQKYFPKF